jgi:hypothetical protein
MICKNIKIDIIIIIFTRFYCPKIIPMKKIYLLIFIIIGLSLACNAQSTRLVLIEEATNASCGPCASQNPAFDALLNQNRDILTAIKYHWYFPGTDPMNAQNPVENNGRVAYYGINGVPTATIDGDIPNGPTFSYPGGPHGYTQELIDEYAAIPSPFNLSISHRLSNDEDSIYIDMMIEATQAIAGDLIAHMVVVEKTITFVSPPGTNGEKVFHDVMRKMVPDNEGTALPTSFQPGDYIILQGSWQLANIYDKDELGVVGFIQSNSSKDVHQTANSSTDPLTPIYENEATIASVKNISETNCLGSFAPTVRLRNQGSDPMTSVEIHYSVNNETELTYTWNGNLDFMETAEVTLPQISFDLQDQNNFYTYTVNPNGIPDEFPRNDTLVQPFERAAITPLTVKIMLRTDNNPTQITWEVVNSAGDVMDSGGPYTNPNSMYNETMVLPDMECYLFKIYDAGGDGIVLPGFYTLYYGNGIMIKNGSAFGSVDSSYFEVNTQVGVFEPETEINVGIFPNPATSSVNLYFTIFENEGVTVNIYDLTGRQVKHADQGILPAGPQEVRISSEDINPGLYLVNTMIGRKTYTQKLTIK